MFFFLFFSLVKFFDAFWTRIAWFLLIEILSHLVSKSRSAVSPVDQDIDYIAFLHVAWIIFLPYVWCLFIQFSEITVIKQLMVNFSVLLLILLRTLYTYITHSSLWAANLFHLWIKTENMRQTENMHLLSCHRMRKLTFSKSVLARYLAMLMFIHNLNLQNLQISLLFWSKER